MFYSAFLRFGGLLVPVTESGSIKNHFLFLKIIFHPCGRRHHKPLFPANIFYNKQGNVVNKNLLQNYRNLSCKFLFFYSLQFDVIGANVLKGAVLHPEPSLNGSKGNKSHLLIQMTGGGIGFYHGVKL